MQINWKVRFRNKAWVTAFAAAVLTLLYDLLGMCGVVPTVDQDAATKIVMMLIKLLVMIGVIVDPTSSGVTDSAAAMSYKTPNCVKSIRQDQNSKLSTEDGDTETSVPEKKPPEE